MLPLMWATQTPAILQSSSAEKPAFPLATTAGSVELCFAADSEKPKSLRVLLGKRAEHATA